MKTIELKIFDKNDYWIFGVFGMLFDRLKALIDGLIDKFDQKMEESEGI